MRLRFYEFARDCQGFGATGLYRGEGEHASALTGAAADPTGKRGSTNDDRACILYFRPTEEVLVMQAKRMRLLSATGFTFVLLLIGPARLAAQDSCQPTYDAMSKVMSTPAHLYSTMTGGQNSADKHTTEVIYIGGATYVKVSGKWSRSPMTTQQVMQQEEENRKASKTACKYLRDESVNGEAAAVYSTHSDRADVGIKSDGQIWISKSKGLPLKIEIDISSDGSTNHHSTRYEYANVQVPRLGLAVGEVF
jgi:hypothetical protein